MMQCVIKAPVYRKDGAMMTARLGWITITLAALGLMAMTLVLGGCTNTVDGLGRDVERAGQSIQRAF